MKEIEINSNEAGQRFDKFLGKYLDQAPKSFLYKMLRKKNITLNGKKAAGNEILALGDNVKLFFSDETIKKFSKTSEEVFRPVQKNTAKSKVKLNVLYEDENVIFLNKPVGMLSQKANREDTYLVEYLIEYLLDSGQVTREELKTFHPAVCNRLDRNTSGIVAGGKTLSALQILNEMFRTRSLEKYYLCLVSGKIKDGQRICGYLKKNTKTNKVSVTKEKRETKEALPIETEYTPLFVSDHVTLLKVHLITGKTHQIRAHLAAIGHPIIGDYKYGDFKINEAYKKKYGLKTQLLHAYQLCFPDVELVKNLPNRQIIAPVPDLFKKICIDKGVNNNGCMEFKRSSGFDL